jgi:hypothetical protein
MTDAIPVFVNERRVMIPRGGTAAMAAELFGPGFASGPGAPAVIFTDARGLPVHPDTVLAIGAILRVAVSARRVGGADADG